MHWLCSIFRASSTTWSWERWSASSPSDPYGFITALLSLTRTSSFGATHHLEGKQSYPTLEIGVGIEKGACEESHAQTYTEEYFRIGSRANSDPCGDGAMEFSRTTCFMHANPKRGNGAEKRSAMHMFLSREETEDRKAAFLPPPFG